MAALRPVSEELFVYISASVSGVKFEQFAKAVFLSIFGEKFVPLGGIHDGGGDGALSSYVQEIEGKVDVFAQFSVNEAKTAKEKIVHTVEALRTAGRTPRLLVYATREALPKADLIVHEVFDSHDVMVQVRDVERIKNYVNNDIGSNIAFYEHFRDQIAELSRAAVVQTPAVSSLAVDPSVYVFVNHELRDRFVRDKLNARVLDALIFWGLRNTDPDKDVLMSASELAAEIESAFPSAKSQLLHDLTHRLHQLSKKDGAGRERLRWHKKADRYCLPYEMRKSLASESANALTLQEKFLASIEERIAAEVEDGHSTQRLNLCKNIVFATVHQFFVEQGVVLASFLEKHLEDLHISDQVVEDIMVEVMSGMWGTGTLPPELVGACLAVLRGIFYGATDTEKNYLLYLSRTSCLMVVMQSAPKLLEYFNQMAGNFRLFVGSDLIVKVLSEHYLPSEQRQVTNLLLACKQLGADLILTEPTLNEVFTHFHAADLEYRNHYFEQEQYVKAEDVAQCNRILIRAYFHARRMSKSVRSWRDYVNQFTDPVGLRERLVSAQDQLRAFLVPRFGMSYLSFGDLEAGVKKQDVLALASALERYRNKHADLSYNDALMAYAVYGMRRHKGEAGIYDGFGYRTWWLTKETTVLSLTGGLVMSEGGVPYIMRPEFLLNFIALAPKAAEVRKTFGALLPTTAGLQLGQYLEDAAMHSILADAADCAQLAPERVSALVAERVNKLQHDRFKRYVKNIA
ncbi:hypothetical protein [Burkholderia ubonensis]|nr:hypothetical protein [Burkholderia ubonensis]